MKSVAWRGCKKREFDENEGEGKEKMKRLGNLPFWKLAASCRSWSFRSRLLGALPSAGKFPRPLLAANVWRGSGNSEENAVEAGRKEEG